MSTDFQNSLNPFSKYAIVKKREAKNMRPTLYLGINCTLRYQPFTSLGSGRLFFTLENRITQFYQSYNENTHLKKI